MAVRFNGNGEYLIQSDVVGAFNYNDAYTLMAWYYPVTISTGNNFGFLWVANAALTAYDAIGQMKTTSGSDLFVQDSVSGFSEAGTTVSTATWHHTAMVRHSSSLFRGYWNGAQFASDGTGDVSGRAAAERIMIGNPSGAAYINSRFAHAKLWRVGLSPEEIRREMWSIAPVTNLAHVVSWWPIMSDDRKLSYGGGYPLTENGTLSDEADPGIAWKVAKPRPMIWWMPPTTSIIPRIRHHMAQQGMA